MNANQREQVRLSILRWLNEAAPYGLSTAILWQQLRNEGNRHMDSVELLAEIEYLEGKKLIEKREKLISPEIAVWKITSAGRDHFAANE